MGRPCILLHSFLAMLFVCVSECVCMLNSCIYKTWGRWYILIHMTQSSIGLRDISIKSTTLKMIDLRPKRPKNPIYSLSAKGWIESWSVALSAFLEEVLQSVICKVWIFNSWRNVRAESICFSVLRANTAARLYFMGSLWLPSCVHSTHMYGSMKILLPTLLPQRHTW